jgi:hypothetical protein
MFSLGSLWEGPRLVRVRTLPPFQTVCINITTLKSWGVSVSFTPRIVTQCCYLLHLGCVQSLIFDHMRFVREGSSSPSFKGCRRCLLSLGTDWRLSVAVLPYHCRLLRRQCRSCYQTPFFMSRMKCDTKNPQEGLQTLLTIREIRVCFVLVCLGS